MNRIGHLLVSVVHKTADPAWISAQGKISDQRLQVDSHLAASPKPVYGFTTLLGHLDQHAASVADQKNLLDAHLVGTRSPLADGERRLAWGVKLEQLSHGGSGIGPEAYSALLDEFEAVRPIVQGNWTGSYGSGDVVPAAWLTAGLPGATTKYLDTPGNLIALINGHFFSTAKSVSSALRLLFELAHLMTVWAPEYLTTSNDKSGAQGVGAFRQRVPTQRPVSTRDPGSMLATIDSCIRQLRFALEHRLSTPSFNPLWVETEANQLLPLSNNNFLDHRLTLALTNAVQLAHLSAGLWQRLIIHEAENEARTEPLPHLVQPPKIAQALIEEMNLCCSTMPARFSGHESAGIEDIRDLSLLTANMLDRATQYLAQLRHLWRDTFPITEQPALHRTALNRLMAVLLESEGRTMDPSIAQAVEEFAMNDQ